MRLSQAVAAVGTRVPLLLHPGDVSAARDAGRLAVCAPPGSHGPAGLG